jgi:hypothetical protein
MPPIHLAALGKPEFLQCFECLCRFLEIKLGLYCNISLGLFAGSKCDKASLLGFGQNEIPNFGIHAGSPPDSGRPKYGAWSDKKQTPAATIHNAIRKLNLPTVTL